MNIKTNLARSNVILDASDFISIDQHNNKLRLCPSAMACMSGCSTIMRLIRNTQQMPDDIVINNTWADVYSRLNRVYERDIANTLYTAGLVRSPEPTGLIQDLFDICTPGDIRAALHSVIQHRKL